MTMSDQLDLRGLDVTQDSAGRPMAVCPGCNQWVLLNNYQGDLTVTRQVPHRAPCSHFETMLFNGELL